MTVVKEQLFLLQHKISERRLVYGCSKAICHVDRVPPLGLQIITQLQDQDLCKATYAPNILQNIASLITKTILVYTCQTQTKAKYPDPGQNCLKARLRVIVFHARLRDRPAADCILVQPAYDLSSADNIGNLTRTNRNECMHTCSRSWDCAAWGPPLLGYNACSLRGETVEVRKP